jgi:hypothetical protein
MIEAHAAGALTDEKWQEIGRRVMARADSSGRAA